MSQGLPETRTEQEADAADKNAEVCLAGGGRVLCRGPEPLLRTPLAGLSRLTLAALTGNATRDAARLQSGACDRQCADGRGLVHARDTSRGVALVRI